MSVLRWYKDALADRWCYLIAVSVSLFRVLCIYTFPACNKTHAVKDLLCKEACSLVKDVICEKEWKQVVAWKEGSLISADIDIPDCKNVPYNFPSMENSSCLYPDLLHGKYLSSHVYQAIIKS